MSEVSLSLSLCVCVCHSKFEVSKNWANELAETDRLSESFRQFTHALNRLEQFLNCLVLIFSNTENKKSVVEIKCTFTTMHSNKPAEAPYRVPATKKIGIKLVKDALLQVKTFSE